MTLTSDLLKNVIRNSTCNSDNLNSFIDSLQEICGFQNETVLYDLKEYLAEEYGIANDEMLRLASIDIKNDICDFVNSKAA